VLPLTVLRHGERLGYGRSLDELLGLALERSDRPRRDAAIVMHADFAHGPEVLPEIIRRLEGGADVVVAEASELAGQPSRGYRWARRGARWLLRGVRVRGVRDIVSGYAAFRLSCLKQARDERNGPLLSSEGWAASAELIARVGRHARRVETVPMVERHDLKLRASRVDPWPLVQQLWRDGGRLHVSGAPRAGKARDGAQGAEDPELEGVTR
jgi:dolichol-phosphate mannosyltransferase